MHYPATFEFQPSPFPPPSTLSPTHPIVLSSFDFNITTLFWKAEGMQSVRYTQKIPSHRKTAHFSGLEFNVALDGNSTRPLKKWKKKNPLSFTLLTESWTEMHRAQKVLVERTKLIFWLSYQRGCWTKRKCLPRIISYSQNNSGVIFFSPPLSRRKCVTPFFFGDMWRIKNRVRHKVQTQGSGSELEGSSELKWCSRSTED